MSHQVEARLHQWASVVLTQVGAEIDWPTPDAAGFAVVPPAVAARLGCSESLSLGPGAGYDLVPSLASDLIERLETLLDSRFCVGLTQIPDAYLKRAAMDRPVEEAFTWLNARVQVVEARPVDVAYATWTFHLHIRSDDVFETMVAVSSNCASKTVVRTLAGDDDSDLIAAESADVPALKQAIQQTYPAALKQASSQARGRAQNFIERLERRMDRDCERLRNYYGALLAEDESRYRRNPGITPETQQSRTQAVEAELERKTTELQDRYHLRARLRPVTLLLTLRPTLCVEVKVSRRRDERRLQLYWNSAHKAMEPIACHCCGEGQFSVAFTDRTVLPICASCL